jgi:mannose-6-phosphate isomerase-like protein (cupin superfamily)
MVTLLTLFLLQTPAVPQPTPPPPAPQTATPQAPAPAKPRPATSTTTSLAVTVTDSSGMTISGVTVSAVGPVDREAKTSGDGTIKLTGLRPGTYRVRFSHDGFYTFEKEVSWRAGQPAPELVVTLNAAPPPPAPPPPPPPKPVEPAAPKLPPPGEPKSLQLTDYIEKNFITAKEPHKENMVGCSGVGQAVLWQVREPWEGRQHESADAMLYIIGGEGSLKLSTSDVSVTAGSFAVIPRGTRYGFVRKGRNPLIVLAVLAGAPCAAN